MGKDEGLAYRLTADDCDIGFHATQHHYCDAVLVFQLSGYIATLDLAYKTHYRDDSNAAMTVSYIVAGTQEQHMRGKGKLTRRRSRRGESRAVL